VAPASVPEGMRNSLRHGGRSHHAQ